MNEMRFRLEITVQEYLRFYQGQVDSVRVEILGGKTIQFPASALRKFVDQNGVNGTFRISYDNNNKMIGFERVSN